MRERLRKMAGLCLLVAIPGLPVCRDSGLVRTTSLPETRRGRVLIGHIENRHHGFHSFPVRNFVDMLEFELIESGFEVLDFNPEMIPAKAETTEKAGPGPKDQTADLFPRRLRQIAGERSVKTRIRKRKRFLASDEIKRMSVNSGFDFFLQGAVGTTERGLLGGDFDDAEDSLIFIRVYNRTGRRVGGISFTVDERDFSRASFLRKITAEIAAAFTERASSFQPAQEPRPQATSPAPPQNPELEKPDQPAPDKRENEIETEFDAEL